MFVLSLLLFHVALSIVVDIAKFTGRHSEMFEISPFPSQYFERKAKEQSL